MTTIYLVRHAQTDANLEGIVQGAHDGPINEFGEQQSRILAGKLKGIKFDAAYASNMIRAKRTAEIILLEREIALKTNDLLREREFGNVKKLKLEKTREEIKRLFDEYNLLEREEWLKYRVVPDMESSEEVIARFITVLREIAVVHDEQKVLVVSHGSIIRALLVHLGYGEPRQLASGAVENAGYIVLESDGVDFFIKDTHLVNKKV